MHLNSAIQDTTHTGRFQRGIDVREEQCMLGLGDAGSRAGSVADDILQPPSFSVNETETQKGETICPKSQPE